MRNFIPGQRWICDADLKLGLGTVITVEQRTVTLEFGAVKERRAFAKESAPLTRIIFSAGDVISNKGGEELLIESVTEEEGLAVYISKTVEGEHIALVETDLADQLNLSRPMDRLLNGQLDQDKWFRLRHRTLVENSRQLSNELFGLVGTRTSLLPHQLYIANEVSERHAPRVLLADEVGLGKTIEAGLILHRQLLTERIQRVLVIVPESLVHQWLVEMLRRFNLYFRIFDEDRCQSTEESNDGINPFSTEQLILCSLDFLEADERRVQQLNDAGWDMLVVDEVHHLHWTPELSSPAYTIIENLAVSIPAIVLLTATPEQTGKAGHFARLRLLDKARFSDMQAFINEESSYAGTAGLINSLLDGLQPNPDDIKRTGRLYEDTAIIDLLGLLSHSNPDTGDIGGLRKQIIDKLVDRHGTGRVLFRNTRTAVKGFPPRKLFPVPLPAPVQYSNINDKSAVASMLTPEIVYAAGKSDNDPEWTGIDPRIDWLLNKLRELRPEKVLVITASMQTAIDIVAAIKARAGIHASVFHENMTLLERDRAAAYFADLEEGAQVMICSEIGSEGRNFQFAHHLVLFDLPLNPDLLEQRIGRLDRIGQTRPINIHVPYLDPGTQSIMFRWYHDGLDALQQACPAAYPVYYQLQDELARVLSGKDAGSRETQDLINRTAALQKDMNKDLRQGRDRLLEYNSCRPDLAEALKETAEECDKQSGIATFMDSVYDCFGVHSEEHTTSSLILSPTEKMITPYPGLPDEGMTITYSRETALANEDIHYFTWEHPMVITAIDMVLTSELGNSVLCAVEHPEINGGTLMIECLYIMESAGSSSLQVHRFFPPSLLRVLVDSNGNDVSALLGHEVINASAENVREDVARQVVQLKELEIRKLVAVSENLAQSSINTHIANALSSADRYFTAELERLQELARVNSNIRPDELEFFSTQRGQTREAITATRLRLDAIRVVVAT